jgi:predicted transcriptional regulator
MTSISITIKDNAAKRLDEFAAYEERSRSYLVNKAIEHYLEHQDWMDRETDAAISAADSGEEELIPHDEAMRRLEAGEV